MVIAGVVALAWKTSADREVRTKMPDPDRVFPSRRTFLAREGERGGELISDVTDWSKQIVEFEKTKQEQQ